LSNFTKGYTEALSQERAKSSGKERQGDGGKTRMRVCCKREGFVRARVKNFVLGGESSVRIRNRRRDMFLRRKAARRPRVKTFP